MKNRGWLIYAATSIFSLLLIAASARADALPSPQTLAQCGTFPGSLVEDPAGCASSNGSDAASVSLVLSPFVSLTAQSTSASTPELHGASAFGHVTYSFQVVGGNVGDVVPLLIATNLTALSTESLNNHSYAFASLTVDTSAAELSQVSVCTDPSLGCTATSFSGTLSTLARVGSTVDFIDLLVSTSASGYTRPFSEFASATADPFIFVDPTFANASLYSIVLSPGVANAQTPPPESVPEPASVGLLFLGVLFCALPRTRKCF